jgi:flavin reductase (DIM6/NTAB) family NADH-FMN oxidoreductase RutF/rubredoxin
MEVDMDKTVLYNLSYGLYIVGAKDGARDVGCIVNTVMQSTSKPITLTVCVNKDNFTNACIKKTGRFSVSVLSENTKESTFSLFGFSSSRERDKFAEVQSALTLSGLPYITEDSVGWLDCKVLDFVDNFTHTIFIAELTDAGSLSKAPPMTYAYYHNVIKGKTPPKASAYVPETDDGVSGEAYVCSVCGYRHPDSKADFEALPETYTCPVCGTPKELFEPATPAV